MTYDPVDTNADGVLESDTLGDANTVDGYHAEELMSSGTGDMIADTLSITGWDVVDLANEGYAGDGTKDLADVYTTYGSNTIYVLPSGTYRMSAGIIDEAGFDYVGFVGKPEARINVVDNASDYCFLFGGTTVNAGKVFLHNLTIDITGTDPNGYDIDRGVILATIRENASVKNVELVGARHRYQDLDTGVAGLETVGGRETFLINAYAEDAFVKYENVVALDGGTYESTQSEVGHATAFAPGGPSNVGTTYMLNCQVAGFIGNGFYVKNTESQHILIGCTARNCGNSNIRPGDNDVVLSCQSVIDDASLRSYSTTGFLVQESENLYASACEIRAPDANDDVIRVEGNSRNCKLENFDIEIGSDVTVDIRGTASGEGVVLSNWVVEDTGASGGQNSTVRVTREDVTIRDCYINSTDKFNIKAETDAGGLTVEDCYLVTGRDHLLLGDQSGLTLDTVTVRNTTFADDGTGGGGFYLYSGDVVGRLSVSDCNFTTLADPASHIYGDVLEWRTDKNQNFGVSRLGPAAVDSLEAPTGTPVQPWGNSGEFVLLEASSSGAGDRSTTRNSYSDIQGATSNDRMFTSSVNAADYTNIDSIWVSFVIRLGNDTAGETTFARLKDASGPTSLTETEVSVTGTTPQTLHSERQQHSPGQDFWVVEGYVTGGVGAFEANSIIYIWGRIA